MEKLLTDPKFDDIRYNLSVIRNNISESAEKAGKTYKNIHFMAVTKTIPPKYINCAIDDGIRLIGENRVQEFLEKLPDIELNDCSPHLIGHLQTNKVRKIIGKVDLIHSVDSINLANEISRCASNVGIVQKVLAEVNVGCEFSKFGFEPDEVIEKVYELSEVSNIKVCGLMCVAPICEDKTELHHIFERMHNMFVDIGSKKMDNVSMDYLSMGMSGDYMDAILCGSNLVRVGSAIFGPRIYSDKH